MALARTDALGVLLAGVAALLLAGCGGASGDPTGAPDPAGAPTSAGSAEPGSGQGGGGQGGGGQGGGGQGDGQGQGAQVGPADDSVPDALDFSAVQVSGAAFDARELAGSDTVFWFWAPWCTECAAAAADVQATAAATSDVAFVGVAGLSSDVDAMEMFVDDHGLTFTQLADSDGSVYTRFGVVQQDTYVLVSADGDVETEPAYGDSVDLDALVADTFG